MVCGSLFISSRNGSFHCLYSKKFHALKKCFLINLHVKTKAPGLSILPFYLIKGKSKIDAEYDEIHHRLALVRERQQLIESKYSGSDELPLDAHDYRTLENLNDEERFKYFIYLCVCVSINFFFVTA